MRALVLSDIHSNLEALLQVFEDAEIRGGFDEVWCLGDTVGYGPDPGKCVDLLQGYNPICVVGNHDLAATGKLSTDNFNPHAAHAAQWTATQLSSDHARFLSSLPEVAQRGDFTLVHGSLRLPVEEYILSKESAWGTFAVLESLYCLVGHSHIPFINLEGDSEYEFQPFPEDEVVDLGQERLIINPGGVGQPRDGDPRPSYALVDDVKNTIERHRVSYDLGKTQEKMRTVGLPEPLISRLNLGR